MLCEDTRRTQVLLDRYGIRARGLVSVHRHNEARQARELLPRLAVGRDASRSSPTRGCPASTTRAAASSQAALAAEVEVTVLPGPSAVETALVASGLAGGQYRFLGYLPRRAAELEALWQELASVAVRGRRVRVAQAPCRVARGPRPQSTRPGASPCAGS